MSLRLLREIHGILLRSGRGTEKAPGEFRRSQVWIGGSRPGNARFVPPPADSVVECMGALEKFLHGDPVQTPVLIKAALAHVQFETIHPFLDGNAGLSTAHRLSAHGRRRALGAHSVPESLLQDAPQEYYEHLQRVRTHGTGGVASLLPSRCGRNRRPGPRHDQRILSLFDKDRRRLEGLGRATVSASRVLEQLQKKPIAGVQELAKVLSSRTPPLPLRSTDEEAAHRQGTHRLQAQPRVRLRPLRRDPERGHSRTVEVDATSRSRLGRANCPRPSHGSPGSPAMIRLSTMSMAMSKSQKPANAVRLVGCQSLVTRLPK